MLSNDSKIFQALSFSHNWFKDIHPNYITIFGFFLNFIIFDKIEKNEIATANLFIILRYLCDEFDGGIARKFNKQSKLGGFLDTVSDNVFHAFYVYIILKYFFKNESIAFYGAIVNTLFNAYYICINNGLFFHDSLKKKDSNNSNQSEIMIFFTNNLWFVNLMLILFNIYFLKK